MKAYHYTNQKAYESMKTKGIDGYYCFEFDNFTGLIPRRRFIIYGRGSNLSDKAREGVVEAVLEPEPQSWINNKEFPNLWDYLIEDICREKQIILLSFDILPKDKAYVVERAHIERELYREAMGFGMSTTRTMNKACQKYWKSRIPALGYNLNYSVPQLSIWSGIEFKRLNIEWIKSSDEFWNSFN